MNGASDLQSGAHILTSNRDSLGVFKLAGSGVSSRMSSDCKQKALMSGSRHEPILKMQVSLHLFFKYIECNTYKYIKYVA